MFRKISFAESPYLDDKKEYISKRFGDSTVKAISHKQHREMHRFFSLCYTLLILSLVLRLEKSQFETL